MRTSHYMSVLALFPTNRVFAFVYFENAGCLVDWSVSEIRGAARRRNALTMERVEALLEKYHPDVVVLEETSEPGTRRSARIRRLHDAIRHAAIVRNIEVERISKKQIESTFSSVGAVNRYEIALAVARQFPELGFRLPRKRKPWEAEHPALALFAAVALGVSWYERCRLDGEVAA